MSWSRIALIALALIAITALTDYFLLGPLKQTWAATPAPSPLMPITYATTQPVPAPIAYTAVQPAPVPITYTAVQPAPLPITEAAVATTTVTATASETAATTTAVLVQEPVQAPVALMKAPMWLSGGRVDGEVLLGDQRLPLTGTLVHTVSSSDVQFSGSWVMRSNMAHGVMTVKGQLKDGQVTVSLQDELGAVYELKGALSQTDEQKASG